MLGDAEESIYKEVQEEPKETEPLLRKRVVKEEPEVKPELDVDETYFMV
jgi:hypothetical protein